MDRQGRDPEPAARAGPSDQASQAEQELPDQVDTDQHADLLQRFGLDPQKLL